MGRECQHEQETLQEKVQAMNAVSPVCTADAAPGSRTGLITGSCLDPLNGTLCCTVAGKSESAAKASDTDWETCLESNELFFKALKVGRLRGVVAFIGNGGGRPGDDAAEAEQVQQAQLHLVQEMLKRDMYPLVSACVAETIFPEGRLAEEIRTAAGHGLKEFCGYLEIPLVLEMDSCVDVRGIEMFFRGLAEHAGVEVESFPLAVVAPGWFLEKSPAISGCAVATSMFTGASPEETADGIDAHIHDRRLKLGWFDHYRCTIHS